MAVMIPDEENGELYTGRRKEIKNVETQTTVAKHFNQK